MHIAEECLYPVQAAIEQWTDKRVIDDIDLQTLLLFMLYLPKVFSQNDSRLCGFSCRRKHAQTLLTVKAVESGLPLVAFVTANSPIGCMSRFLDLLEDDRLTWNKDKYPWI